MALLNLDIIFVLLSAPYLVCVDDTFSIKLGHFTRQDDSFKIKKLLFIT